jgi:hypothetical protein
MFIVAIKMIRVFTNTCFTTQWKYKQSIGYAYMPTCSFCRRFETDQLSNIRNWGGCEVILGPDATVTIKQPAQ